MNKFINIKKKRKYIQYFLIFIIMNKFININFTKYLIITNKIIN